MVQIHRVAVVGAGVIGTWHAKVIDELESAELACVVDVFGEAARTLSTRYSVPAFATLSDALAVSDFDIVAVCTPSGLHADIAVEALGAGKHTIVEKPIDTTLEAADRVIDAQRGTGLLATVIHQHRFDSSTRVMMRAIRAGELGRMTSGIVSGAWWRSQEYYDSGDWRGTWDLDGGGALMNQGIHAAELLVSALGTPVTVSARTACLAHERIEVEDTVVATVVFESGALATIHATTAASPGVCSRIQVHGDRGSAVLENDDLVFISTAGEAGAGGGPGSSRAAGNQVENYRGELEDAGPTATSNPGQLSDSHRYQYENLIAALAGEEDLEVSLEDARRALALALAVYESARTGHEVSVDGRGEGGVRSRVIPLVR